MKSEDGDRFRNRYEASGAEALLAAEREALGSDYQANGYTTITQADELGLELRLGPDQVLVDIGAGCGWPGLYLAAKHGCAVVSIDPVTEGMDAASRRAISDGFHENAWAIRGGAEALSLRSQSVDAIVHTDLLC